jgi:hypothetical protein
LKKAGNMVMAANRFKNILKKKPWKRQSLLFKLLNFNLQLNLLYF